MFALQSLHETDINQRAHYLELAEKIGETCHESYNRTSLYIFIFLKTISNTLWTSLLL